MVQVWLTIITPLLGAIVAAPAHAQDVADTFERVHTAVVTIRSTSLTSGHSNGPTSEVRVGSGVLFSREGSIMTAAHVVGAADRIEVEFYDGTAVPARIVALEREPDLAVLKLDSPPPRDAAVAVLGDSNDVRIGSRILVIGAPLDLAHSLTVGYVSARRRGERHLGRMRRIEHFQTDAAINMGNSGGPMFNIRGEVVGIVCHIVSKSGANEGLGFAVTSNEARRLVLDPDSVWLGFDAVPLPVALSRSLNVPDGRTGLLVQRVTRSSPGHALGLRGGTIPIEIGKEQLVLGGDIILDIQGHSVGSPEEVAAAIESVRELPEGAELRMTVLRSGQMLVLETRLGN